MDGRWEREERKSNLGYQNSLCKKGNRSYTLEDDRFQKGGYMRYGSAPESKMTKATSASVLCLLTCWKESLHKLDCELSINRMLKVFYDKIWSCARWFGEGFKEVEFYDWLSK